MKNSLFRNVSKIAEEKDESDKVTKAEEDWLDKYISERRSKTASTKDTKAETSKSSVFTKDWWKSDDPDDDDIVGGGDLYSRGYDAYSYNWKDRWSEKSYGRGFYAGGSSSVLSGSNYSYSSSFSSMSDTRELLDIKSFVTNLLRIHDSLSKRLVSTNTSVEYTNGLNNIFSGTTSTIHLLRDVLCASSTNIPFNDKLDITSGYVLMASTMGDSDPKTEIQKIVSPEIDKITVNAKLTDEKADNLKKLLKCIASMIAENIIEDEVLTKSPGYKNYVESFRNYYYTKRSLDSSHLSTTLDIVYAQIRCPENVEEYIEDLEKSGKYNSKQLKNFKDVAEAIKHSYDNDVVPSIDKIADMSGQIIALIMSVISDKDLKDVSDNINDMLSTQSALLDSEEIRPNFASFNRSLSQPVTDAQQKSLSALQSLESHDYSRDKMKDPTDGSIYKQAWNINYYTRKGDKNTYNTLRSGIETYVRPLKKMMSFRDFVKKTTLTSQKRGKIDRGKLALANSTNRIYTKTIVDQASSVSICLIIDESGSMSGSRINGAKTLGILFAEAFLDSKSVDIHIYGHTAQDLDHSDQDIIVNKYPTKQSLTDVKSRSQNVDGIAIYAIAKDFEKVAKGNQKIMIVISDGNPNSSGYTGNSAVNHTKQCVDLVEKMGIIPMQVAIEARVDSDRMFKRWFKFVDMNSFLKDMSTMIKKVLKDA